MIALLLGLNVWKMLETAVRPPSEQRLYKVIGNVFRLMLTPRKDFFKVKIMQDCRLAAFLT